MSDAEKDDHQSETEERIEDYHAGNEAHLPQSAERCNQGRGDRMANQTNRQR